MPPLTQQTTTATTTKNPFEQDLQFLKGKVDSRNLPDELKGTIERMLTRVQRVAELTGYSQEFETVSKYVDWVTRLPWEMYNLDNLDINNVRKLLDEHHYGIEKIKREILEYIAVMDLKASKVGGSQVVQAPVMCFVGLQGIGKTTMARSIAQAMGRPMVRIAMGGMSNITELRGSPKSMPDSEPGQIVKALIKANVMNPVIVLDEVDKVSGEEGKSKDFYAALLEVLDPEQNNLFRDHYIDYPIDLSKVLFICTANNLGPISSALLDRMEVIRFMSYTDDEKTVIAKTYLLPKVIAKTGLSNEQIEFTDDVWPAIVRPLGFDAGIRQLERNVLGLCRRVAKEIVDGKATKVIITTANVKDYMPEPSIF
jgi:ATP-dependent Lon protease